MTSTKTDWKYLNDASTRGAIEDGLVPPGFGVSAIDGVLIPAGTSTVYDQILGTNIRRPSCTYDTERHKLTIVV